jgi:hypothetical protein
MTPPPPTISECNKIVSRLLIYRLVTEDDSDSLDEEDLALLEENMGIKLARNEGVSRRFLFVIFLYNNGQIELS